jgi:hypothetical protein
VELRLAVEMRKLAEGRGVGDFVRMENAVLLEQRNQPCILRPKPFVFGSRIQHLLTPRRFVRLHGATPARSSK